VRIDVDVQQGRQFKTMQFNLHRVETQQSSTAIPSSYRPGSSRYGDVDRPVRRRVRRSLPAASIMPRVLHEGRTCRPITAAILSASRPRRLADSDGGGLRASSTRTALSATTIAT
jgi:hypothetical protein